MINTTIFLTVNLGKEEKKKEKTKQGLLDCGTLVIPYTWMSSTA